MILGKITGKITTKNFSFEATADVGVLDYVKVYHPAYDYVLCQVVELTASSSGGSNNMQADCIVIGYYDGRVKQIRIPFEPNSEVLQADDEFINTLLSIPENAAYIGKLDGRDISIKLDLNKMLTKHVSILAKSGAGKSYTVGVLLEEILEHGVPCVVIDPHGEHNSLKRPTQVSEETRERMARYEVQPKGYEIIEFEEKTNPLKLSNKLTRDELVHLLPKLNTTQQGLLFQAIRNSEHTDFDELLLSLEGEESMVKWSLINLIEGLKNYELFSSEPTSPKDLVKPGRAAVINLKGYPPEIQEMMTYKLAKDLFILRKQEKIPPFFLVVEEAHNFCPERSFGEAASSKILRTIASEGRKFGLGLCVISQRPARVDKSVLSQCSTQLILKITNPHDLKAVSNSVEGLTAETEKEIKNIPIGTALVTGVVDLPLMVNVRPRRTEHGGDATQIITPKVEEDENAELLATIMPMITQNDLKIMHDENVTIETVLRPATRFLCKAKEKEFTLLVDRTRNELLVDLEGNTKKLPALQELDKDAKAFLKHLFKTKKAQPEELGIPKKSVQSLIASGYIKKDPATGDYMLSRSYHYASLEKASLATPIQYERMTGRKLDERYTSDEAERMLKRYVNIQDKQDCWYVQYIIKSQQ